MRAALLALLLLPPLASQGAPQAKPREKPYLVQLRARARRGDPKAQFDLAVCYRFGQGGSKDEAAAVAWYLKAAEQGYDKAQYNLAVCYDAGTGIPKDHAEAARWYRRAAHQGHAKAAYNLGVDYKYGQGVDRDDAEAWAWFDLAASLGEALAAVPRDDLTRTFGPDTLQRARERSLALRSTVRPRPVPSKKKARRTP